MVRVVMIETVLAAWRSRSAHEVAWMRDETAVDAQAYARDAGVSLDDARRRAARQPAP